MTDPAYPLESLTAPAPCWETPELTEINRLPMRTRFDRYPDLRLALAEDLARNPWHRSLNGAWDFALFPSPRQVPATALMAPGPDASQSITVPGNWTMQGFDRPHYTNVQMPFPNDPPRVPAENPTGVYRRTFRLPRAWDGRRTVLVVGGAESVPLVYLNGRFVGLGKDSRLESEFDLTPFIRRGDNTLALVCIRWSDASYIEDQDHWWMAGIHRGVALVSVGPATIADLQVDADLADDLTTGLLAVRTHLGFQQEPKADLAVEVALLDAAGRKVWRRPERSRVDCSYRLSGYTAHMQVRIPRVRRWSAETPYLYRLVVSLVDASGACIEATALPIGFRSVRIRNRELQINGCPVLIKGVNRHDHDPVTGKHVSREAMIADIRLLKQNNFNAVRTSHYPNDPEWYRLCDIYGIYLFDEANIECHANYESLCRDPRWHQAFFARGQRMVQRDRNHPSVIAWSLGNESGYGEHHDRMADWIRQADPTRPVHHEGALKPGWSQSHNRLDTGGRHANDFINPMYPDPAMLEAWGKNPPAGDDRPFIACEYSHAMGNSCGSLSDLWTLFRKYHGLQGGFIWDWMEQGLLTRDATGQPFYGYGGDFGDHPNDVNFCCNGMIMPDRTLKPQILEFKHCAQPIQVQALDLKRLKFRIENEDYFQDADWLTGEWVLTVDGVAVRRGRLGRLRLPPRGSKTVTLKLNAKDWQAGGEAHLSFHFRTFHATPWCPAGHEVAWEQFALARKPAPSVRRVPARGPVALHTESGRLALSAAGVTAGFDPKTGLLQDLQLEGQSILTLGPTFNLWRAPIDNDGVRLMEDQCRSPGKALGRWNLAGYDRLAHQVRAVRRIPGRNRFALESHHRYRGSDRREAFEVRLCCALAGDGRLDVEMDVQFGAKLPDPPRLGVRMATAPGFEALSWFGRGPGENYADRKSGSLVGRYDSTVTDQFFPYMVPQETGNKEDVRWMTLARADGTSLRIESPALFSFSALHFAPEDLMAANHAHELTPREATILLVDLQQRGLGTGSCGFDTQPQYQIRPGRYRQRFSITLSR